MKTQNVEINLKSLTKDLRYTYKDIVVEQYLHHNHQRSLTLSQSIGKTVHLVPQQSSQNTALNIIAGTLFDLDAKKKENQK